MTKIKQKRAWMVVSSENDLSPWGNGQEWQYPIFLSLPEAKHFLARNSRTDNNYKIIPVYISPLKK